jgi:hypothetical protein
VVLSRLERNISSVETLRLSRTPAVQMKNKTILSVDVVLLDSSGTNYGLDGSRQRPE